MAKRPPGVDLQTWREQRGRVWARRNRILNLLMLVAVVALLVRYCSPLAG